MIFDENELLKYTENDRVLCAELLQMAVRDIPDFLKKAIDERGREKLPACAVYLHKIKGIAGSIGAVAVHSLSSLIEGDLKKDNTPQTYDANIDALKEAVSAFIAFPEVQNYLNL